MAVLDGLVRFRILEGVSPQLTGILIGIASGIAAAIIYWGGFVEQKRSNEEYASRR